MSFSRIWYSQINFDSCVFIISKKEAEGSMRKRLKELYAKYLREMAKDLCGHLVEEDRSSPTDIYLWWSQRITRVTLF